MSIWIVLVSAQLGATPQSHWQGRPIPLTPFDLKVIGSGFYQIEDEDAGPSRQSLQEIFSIAAAFRYQLDNSQDNWQPPQVTEFKKSGDCEDMALWVYEKLKENGYAGARIMIGKFEASDKKMHAWAVCSAPGGDDYIIDPALQTRIWKRSELLPDVYQPEYSFDGNDKYSHSD